MLHKQFAINFVTTPFFEESFFSDAIPYKSLILGQLIDLISPAKINLFKTRFKSYDPWELAYSLLCFFNKKIED